MELKRTDGLALAEKYYREYGSRARELKSAGAKVIGYLSALGPVEVLTAAGVSPIRLKGSVSEPITKADAYMETIVCPFIRNVFDATLKGKFDYLDGIVMPHQCDSTDKTSNEWRYNLSLPYFHFLNVPHLTDDSSVNFFRSVLGVFIRSLERFTGREITEAALAAAIGAHNENRRAVRDLYNLRKQNPPLISGSEMTKVLVAAMSLPVEESTALVRNVAEEVRQRPAPSGNGSGARLMLMGDQVDDVAIAQIIEAAGASLVMDDLSIGSKIYWTDVDISSDPLRAIAERYLRKVKLPTTFIAEGNSYEENLEARFGHVKRYIEEFKVNGVILFVYRYCDPYGFEVPSIKSYIESAGAPVLYLEDEYSTSSLGRVKTRVEAFLEMIG